MSIRSQNTSSPLPLWHRLALASTDELTTQMNRTVQRSFLPTSLSTSDGVRGAIDPSQTADSFAPVLSHNVVFIDV